MLHTGQTMDLLPCILLLTFTPCKSSGDHYCWNKNWVGTSLTFTFKNSFCVMKEQEGTALLFSLKTFICHSHQLLYLEEGKAGVLTRWTDGTKCHWAVQVWKQKDLGQMTFWMEGDPARQLEANYWKTGKKHLEKRFLDVGIAAEFLKLLCWEKGKHRQILNWRHNTQGMCWRVSSEE